VAYVYLTDYEFLKTETGKQNAFSIENDSVDEMIPTFENLKKNTFIID
jgi:hypothetical protein